MKTELYIIVDLVNVNRLTEAACYREQRNDVEVAHIHMR